MNTYQISNLTTSRIDKYPKKFIIYFKDIWYKKLSTEDLNNIFKSIGKNYRPKANTRSAFINTNTLYQSKNFPYQISAFQIKGVYFSANIPICPYRGIGVCPEYYYANKLGSLVKLSQFKKTVIVEGRRIGLEGIGCMDFQEAVKEFYYTSVLLQTKNPLFCVKVPIAYGFYTNQNYDNGNLGFVVFGHDKSILSRSTDYIQSIKIKSTKLFIKIIKKRTKILKYLHNHGYLVPFLTLDNLQVFNKSKSILHDIGDARFLNKDIDKLTESQFRSEKFWNLFYILQDNRAILPGAPYFSLSQKFIQKNYNLFFKATLNTYFGKSSKRLKGITPRDFHQLHSLLLSKPINQINHPLLNLL